jgi:GTP pyrophosphokinase
MSEKKLVPIVEDYNIKEEYLYLKTYLFIKGYAVRGGYMNTLKALPLARQLHNGQYRKGLTEVDGEMVHLPYILHCLKVCDTLMQLNLPLKDEDADILYAAALLHDTLEDAEEHFPQGGIELVNVYGFPKEVYKIIKLLSKHAGATEYELNEYFNKIKKNKLALLIKMADRSHNVEDLYNMKVEKLHKYVRETRDYIYPLSSYAKQNYPELSSGVTILKSKIKSLTELTETLVNIYTEQLEGKDTLINEKDELIANQQTLIEQLQKEIEFLKQNQKE